MEFVIEEIISTKEPPQRRMWQVKLCLFKKRFINGYQQIFANITIQQELWCVLGLSIILIGGLVGRDLWIIQRQKSDMRQLETNIRALSQQQQQLQKVISPLSRDIQAIWLRTQEENTTGILKIIAALAQELQDSVRIVNIQKYPQDPHIYLEGIAKTYDDIFILEQLLATKKWQAIVNLSAKESDYYHYKVQMAPQKE